MSDDWMVRRVRDSLTCGAGGCDVRAWRAHTRWRGQVLCRAHWRDVLDGTLHWETAHSQPQGLLALDREAMALRRTRTQWARVEGIRA